MYFMFKFSNMYHDIRSNIMFKQINFIDFIVLGAQLSFCCFLLKSATLLSKNYYR